MVEVVRIHDVIEREATVAGLAVGCSPGRNRVVVELGAAALKSGDELPYVSRMRPDALDLARVDVEVERHESRAGALTRAKSKQTAVGADQDGAVERIPGQRVHIAMYSTTGREKARELAVLGRGPVQADATEP